ncbi:kinase-like domain-containing protein [Rhizophagus clarus]|uniref:Kinase-like domain-containing protein n=1 Tax=Rhizophagus clarus TaxID=94130 RepID=A0A8H3KZG2_9GLOM|nr:kinase-like domain-containing protein [Rhizophagus clarus]
MSTFRYDLIGSAINRAYSLIDTRIHNNNIHTEFEFQKQTVLADKTLTNDEQNEAKCQMESFMPDMIIEWISYSDLQDVEYLTKGGCSEIYTAIWISGRYDQWNSKNQQLKRKGNIKVVLKKLENVENASQSWFEEAKSHLTISNKRAEVVRCYGLTKDPSDGNYMLVIMRMNINLREYLQQNHNQLTWKERINIAYSIINNLSYIHKENAIHRDLHSGNILYSQLNDYWYIADLGFCGPVDKPLRSVYGNLPYIAPEVIAENQTTFASDVYSIAILMWEISSGQVPFVDYERDYYLATNIINGIRPKIVQGTPLEYESLMKQCWDADPLKRIDSNTLKDKIGEIHLHYQNESNELFQSYINDNSNISNNTNSSRLLSKVYQLENFSVPRNATEEEQEAFHSKPYDFDIPDDINDFDKSINTNKLLQKE